MIIDGNSIINRAFYGITALTNKKGEYTNAIYGFLNIFFKLYDEEKPEYIAVAFDLKAKTFRHEKFGDYKAHRKGMPVELAVQMPVLKELLAKMNINLYEKEGFEADDILGTLAKKCEEQGKEVVLISGDRDLLQLATDKIKVRIPRTKAGKTEIETYYAKDVIEQMGVTPTEYIDVKALMGDASDNIPGVPGIGEKTAFKIISEYKNIETAIENYAEITPKTASNNLNEHRELAVLSKELATIILDVPVDVPSVPTTNIFNEEVAQMFRELEFKSLLTRFKESFVGEVEAPQKPISHNFEIITTDIKNFIGDLKDKVAFSIVYFLGDPVGFSFATSSRKIFVPYTESLLSDCKSFFESDIEKILLDSKTDMVFLRKRGIYLNNVVFDCVLSAYILGYSKTTYADIAIDFLNQHGYLKDAELSGKGKNKKSFDKLSLSEQVSYGAGHGAVAFDAFSVMEEKLSNNGQENLYYNIELPLASVLADMETIGIKIDRQALINFDAKLTTDIEELTSSIYDLAGEEFNINSPSQLGVILFEKIGLRGGKKTKTGYSTAADILEKLRDKHDIIPKILQYRTLAKLKSTYCEGLLSVTDVATDKIYSTFNQAVTATGRLSSTEPNLQNIPIRTELGRQLRKVFIPTDDTFVFLDADYSQIELRILAHLSADPILINAYKNNDDIHKITASQVLGIPIDELTTDQRNSAKAVNFGIIYGMGSFSLSEDLKITKKEADNYIEGYFRQYPSVKAYMDNCISSAKELGYARTIFGRRRDIPELKASNFIQRSFGERVAMNMPIQGAAADIIKIAMNKVSARLKNENLQSRLILQVHDELLLEVKKAEIDIVKKLLQEEMESAADLAVPLVAEVHQGDTWFDTK